MGQPTPVDGTKSGARAWHHSRQRLSMSKSSTGDMDSENLWTAAADDFSFFAEGGGEEEDECGIYEHEKDRYFPSVNVDDKIALSPEEAFDISGGGRDSPHSPHLGGTLSPVHALERGGVGGGTMWQSPRQLPMGRNRRPSNEHPRSGRSSFEGGQQQRPFTPELPGTMPTPSQLHLPRQVQAPGSMSQLQQQRRFAPTSAPNVHFAPSPLTMNGHTGGGDVSPPISPIEEPEVDVVTALSSFRKARKAAFEAEMAKFARFKAGLRPEDAEGLLPPFVEGYWSGEIKVVRNSAPKGRSGVVDMYGNYFEKGYLYP